jgi:hypothetical protein
MSVEAALLANVRFALRGLDLWPPKAKRPLSNADVVGR